MARLACNQKYRYCRSTVFLPKKIPQHIQQGTQYRVDLLIRSGIYHCGYPLGFLGSFLPAEDRITQPLTQSVISG